MNSKFKPVKVPYSEYVNFDKTGHAKLTYVNVDKAYGRDEDLFTYSLHSVGNIVYNKTLSGIDNVEVFYFRTLSYKNLEYYRDKVMRELKFLNN